MANAPSYVSYSHVGGGSQDLEFRYTITFSGSYTTASTGEVVNLNNALNPNGLELNAFLPPILPEGVPDCVGANINGYDVSFSAYANGSFTVKFYSTAATELGTGAYPASISGGNVIIAVRSRG